MRLAVHVAHVGDRSSPYRYLVRRAEGKRPRLVWEGNIKMSLQEVGWGGMDWIDLALDIER